MKAAGSTRRRFALPLGLLTIVAGAVLGYEDMSGVCSATAGWPWTWPLAVLGIGGLASTGMIVRMSGSIVAGGLVAIVTVLAFLVPHVVLGCPA